MKIEISKLTEQDKKERNLPKITFYRFKNLKIPVENNLDEIVVELERLGFRASQLRHNPKYINTTGYGYFLMTNHPWDFPLTTLVELKEM